MKGFSLDSNAFFANSSFSNFIEAVVASILSQETIFPNLEKALFNLPISLSLGGIWNTYIMFFYSKNYCYYYYGGRGGGLDVAGGNGILFKS